MQFNTFNRFQRLHAPDPDGLSARLASFVAGEAPPAKPVALTQPAKEEEKAEVKPEVKPDAKPESKKEDPKPSESTDDSDDEEDEVFPEIGKADAESKPEDKKPDALDEAAFDAETAKASEGMDEKASTKFKALRAELKEFKKREFKPDPESIPEFTAIKAEVEELRKIKEESEGLKARLDSVLSANDELAVKEGAEFIEKVKKPVAEMKSAIEAISGALSIPPADLMAIIAEEDLSKQDKALSHLENKVSRRTLSKIERLCDDYRIIQQDEARILSDVPKSAAEARKRAQEAEIQARNERTGEFKESVRKSFAEYAKVIPGFTDSSGQLTETAKEAMNVSVSYDPHDLGATDLGWMIFASKALPAARKEIKRLQKENSRLKGSSSETIPGAPAIEKKPAAGSDEPRGNTLRERMKGQSFTFNPSMVG